MISLLAAAAALSPKLVSLHDFVLVMQKSALFPLRCFAFTVAFHRRLRVRQRSVLQAARLAFPAFSCPAMAPRFNPYPEPKHGKGRSVLGRPASTKDKNWQNIKYVRTPWSHTGRRHDRSLWQITLWDLMNKSDAELVTLLQHTIYFQNGKRSALDATRASFLLSRTSEVQCPSTGATGKGARSM